MTPQELKNSILQLAIQGRLVEQRPEEGSAEELYKQIQAEKQKLVKVGTITKEKPLPKVIEDEKQYDIPESWIWVKLGDIYKLIMGQSPDGKSVSENTSGMEFHQGKVFFGEDYLHESNKVTNKPVKVAEPHSVLLCVRAPVGTVNITEREVCIGRGLCAVSSFVGMDAKYILYSLRSLKTDFIRKATGTTFIAITSEVVKNQVVPLPPLAEQQRIVAKIEELLPYVDRYEKAWGKLEDFNNRFPDTMQKSILQMAIQGKLVEQRPAEGTGENLYQQIQAEKQRLTKAGTIKKEKPLPEITEDEKPFDIPENWKWVRIGQVFSLQAGKNITASDIYEDPSPEHSFLCYGGNGIRGYVGSNNRSGHFALIGRQGALCGNINFAKGDFYATEHAVVVDHFQMCDALWSGYFLRALNLNQYATATAQPGLAVSNIVKVLIPLPPLAEQKRIVTKLEEILPLCDRLKR